MLLNCGIGEDSWESPLDSKEIQPVHPKRNQSWIFFGRTDAEAETPIIWPPDVKNWLIWKDPDAGKDWRWEEKGMTENEMIGWHHWLNKWVWVNSESWWWTVRQGVLQSMESQRVGHGWATELNWTVHKVLLLAMSEWVKVAQLCPILCNPMEFSRPEYWSGVPLPSPTMLSSQDTNND